MDEQNKQKYDEKFLENFDTGLFQTEEEKVIGNKAIGAYLGLLSLYLDQYFVKYPDGSEELLRLLGYTACVCSTKIL
jgi:hypothetical protein